MPIVFSSDKTAPYFRDEVLKDTEVIYFYLVDLYNYLTDNEPNINFIKDLFFKLDLAEKIAAKKTLYIRFGIIDILEEFDLATAFFDKHNIDIKNKTYNLSCVTTNKGRSVFETKKHKLYVHYGVETINKKRFLFEVFQAGNMIEYNKHKLKYIKESFYGKIINTETSYFKSVDDFKVNCADYKYFKNLFDTMTKTSQTKKAEIPPICLQ